MVKRFRRLYGAGPRHLLALIASLVISGAAVLGWFASFTTPDIVRILIWFLGAAVAHDLIVLPLYSVLDRGALLGLGVHRREPPADPAAPPPDRSPGWVYVRIPALFSGLLILVFFPEALRLGNPTFQAASGMTQDVYLSRLLITCGAAFAISGVAYAASVARARATGRAGRPAEPGQPDMAREPGAAEPGQGGGDESVSPDTRAP